MDATLIPGTIPDLLRARSAAVLGLDRPDIPRHLWGKSATVHRITPSDLGVTIAALAVDGCESVVIAGLDVLSLDLTDATGRAHAAWWLAAWIQEWSTGGWHLHHTEAHPPRLRWSMPWAKRFEQWRYRSLYLLGFKGFADRQPPPSEAVDSRMVAQALARLDPDDPRLLPDGSRWVDAEALRVVCLHVAITRYPDHPAAAEWRAALETR